MSRIESTKRQAVVVTGCSSGIGRATALQLASDGFHVFAGVRRIEDGDRLAAESTSIEPLMLDVRDSETIQFAVSQVREQFPDGIDGLVNNAGMCVAGPLEWVAAEHWQEQFEVNVLGIVRATQAFLPLIRKRVGRIVNISSAASSLALPMVGAYASSKFAVDGLSDSLRRELSSSGIKVIVVCPGQTATPIFTKSEQDVENRLESRGLLQDQAYAAELTRFQQLMHQSKSSRLPPRRVASVVVKALTTHRPRRRYHVGWDAKAAVLVQRLVPDAWVDWFIGQTLRPTESSNA